MREFLAFLYTDKCEEGVLQTCGEQLLIAANKYKVSGLQTECVQYLQQTLSAGNVFERLIFADLHNCAELKKKAIAFIAANKVCVKESVKWIARLGPELFEEVMSAVAERVEK